MCRYVAYAQGLSTSLTISEKASEGRTDGSSVRITIIMISMLAPISFFRYQQPASFVVPSCRPAPQDTQSPTRIRTNLKHAQQIFRSLLTAVPWLRRLLRTAASVDIHSSEAVHAHQIIHATHSSRNSRRLQGARSRGVK